MKKYVVIGSSAAGVNGIRELRKYDKDAEIVLISKDKDIYSRCILHEYLAGKRSILRDSLQSQLEKGHRGSRPRQSGKGSHP